MGESMKTISILNQKGEVKKAFKERRNNYGSY